MIEKLIKIDNRVNNEKDLSNEVTKFNKKQSKE